MRGRKTVVPETDDKDARKSRQERKGIDKTDSRARPDGVREVR